MATKAGNDRRAASWLHIAPNIAVKVPLTAGRAQDLQGPVELRLHGQRHALLLGQQALLAAKAGATFISPFIGRLDDINLDGLDLIGDIRTIYDNYDFQTQILAASIRTANYVKDCALIGADVVTAPGNSSRRWQAMC